ncbi:MAG: DUF2726 domain-containing protein [Oscillospiraceae bacterium]|nr:DUF2726 domain-containing protein [Oscillospiraceae bacterium]
MNNLDNFIGNNLIYITAAAAVILLAAIAFIFGRKKRLPYIKAENLLTKNERDCYMLLRDFSDRHGYDVLCKIRFADIVNVCKGTKDYMKWFNKIKSKHIDFVLCRKYETDPVLLIELDDRSHDAPERIERDNFVDEVCGVCGIDIVHIYRRDFAGLDGILKKHLG